MMKIYMFPGQGSQKKGMGGELFDLYPDMTKQADKILGYSVKELCLNDSEKKLNQTQYTQPALYVVNALSYRRKVDEGGTPPEYAIGHSLGEYNALYAAEVFSFEEGLKLVKKRGELMALAKGGSMAAIINASEKEIRSILHDAGLEGIDLANLNSPNQIVISGMKEEINQSQSAFEKAGKAFIPLNTSGAFHSRYMKEAEAEFGKLVRKASFSRPAVKVVANLTGKLYRINNISNNLIGQISNCVRWTDSVRYILSQGEADFEELGVGDVLTKLVRAIKSDYELAKTPSRPSVSPAPSASPTPPVVEKEEAATPENNEPKVKSAEAMVEEWNRNFPVGTKVRSDAYKEELETRTEAVLLFGHRAAVYMKGYNGYFDLREITPVR